MKLIKNVLDTIGNTPIVKLNDPGKPGDFGTFEADLYAKIESHNPSGSIKDRIAKYMIEKAEKDGQLIPGFNIVEATSGNAGISFAMVAALKGYKMVAVMPETANIERMKFMWAYGAEVVLTPGSESVQGSVNKAKELAKQKGWWMPRQFENFDNVDAHRETGKEILKQVPEGKIDAVVLSVGTGGTLGGVGQTIRAVNPKVKVIVAQPAGSQELTGGKPGEHLIGGIADGFVPAIVDKSIIDRFINIKDADAVRMSRRLAKEKGLFVGISSGCNVAAALRVAREMKKGQTIVTVLPDSADRYISLGLFDKIDAEDVKISTSCAGVQ